MAARYLDAIRAVQPTGPYLLGGWSFGGVVAFEMARQLNQQSGQVAHVTLFDAWAPTANQKPPEDSFSTSDLVARFLSDIAGISARELPLNHDLLLRRWDDLLRVAGSLKLGWVMASLLGWGWSAVRS